MANWILKNPPQPLWREFVEKAKREGWPIASLITQFARDYVDGKIKPTAPAPIALPVVVIPKACVQCAQPFEVHIRSAAGFSLMRVQRFECPRCGHPYDELIPGEIVDVTDEVKSHPDPA